MRWLVVAPAAPLAKGPPATAHAHPPGPGFPRQAPSVYTVVATSRESSALLRAYPPEGREHGWRGTRDLRRLRPPAPGHRSRGDEGVARLLRRGDRRLRQEPGALPPDEAAGTGTRPPGGLPRRRVDALREQHRAGPGAVVPRR